MGKPEKAVEDYLVEQIEALNGICYKFTSPNRRNVPDRICVLENGLTIWVEAKAPKEPPRPAQIREINRLIDRGHIVFVIDCKKDVDNLISYIGVKNALLRNIKKAQRD